MLFFLSLPSPSVSLDRERNGARCPGRAFRAELFSAQLGTCSFPESFSRKQTCLGPQVDAEAQSPGPCASAAESPAPERPVAPHRRWVQLGCGLAAHPPLPPSQPQGWVLRPLPGTPLHTVCPVGTLTRESFSQERVGAGHVPTSARRAPSSW